MTLVQKRGLWRSRRGQDACNNVGTDKDSDKRQRAAIEGYAKSNGFQLVGEFYDAAVSGADHIAERKGFSEMLGRIAGNGVRTILVESPDRFARDLAVQLAGHDHLRSLGITLIPASSPDFFIEDTPTAVLVRQVLGAIAQFEKATTVAKLRAARERKRIATGKCEGRKSHAEINPEMVAIAKGLRRRKRGNSCGPSLLSGQPAARSTSTARSSQRRRWPQWWVTDH
jgi:DNA invertase Pin-like site-specific DNA recombinase